MEAYILKSTACLLAFLLFYKLVLEQEKMHKFNRFYLLTALALSFGIPLITYTTIIEVAPLPVLVDAFLHAEYVTDTIADEPINYLLYILGSIYGLGVLFFLTLFIKNCVQLYLKVSTNEKQKTKSSVRVLLQKNVIPHTFLKYIFLEKKALENNEIPAEVLLHEEAHAAQKHSLDIIFVELLQVIFWFNPLLYLTKHSIKLNHEFLADDEVLQKGTNRDTYAEIILSYSSSEHKNKNLPAAIGMANSINYSSNRLAAFGKSRFGQVKKRFTVMKKNTSKKSVWLRSLLLLPLVAALTYGFSNKETVEVITNSNSDTPIETLISSQKLKKEGATEKMMQEYRDYIQNYQNAKKKVVWMDKYNRIIAIYDLMTAEQKASVQDHRNIIRQLHGNLTTTKRKKPSQTEYNSWKNGEKFAIWIDNKHVPNSELDKHTVTDFVHFSGSFVYKNARSERFPQEYQYHLYTEKSFEETYLKSEVNKYNGLLKKYNQAKTEFTKSNKKDNSELRLIHVRLLKMYESLSAEEIKKYKVLMVDAVPVAKAVQQKATPKEVAEYNSIVKKIMSQPERRRIIKQKDVARIKYIYGLMTDEQKRNAEPFPKLAPLLPPPSMDTIYTYNSLSKRTKFIPNNRKNNLQYLKVQYNKMSDSQKKKVESPSSISNYIARINSLTGAQLKKANQVLSKIKANAQSKGRKFYSTAEYKELEELYAGMLNNSTKVKKQEKSNIPPPPPPLPPSKNSSPETVKAKEEFHENAKFYGEAVQSYSKNGKGNVKELQEMYERVMVSYNKFRKLVENNYPPPPPPPPTKVKVGEKSNIPPPPPPLPPSKNSSPEIVKAKEEFHENAKFYGEAVQSYSKNGKGNVKELQEMYKRVMVSYNKFRKLAENNYPPPPPPPPTKVKVGEKSNIPPPPPPKKVAKVSPNYTSYIKERSKALNLLKDIKSSSYQIDRNKIFINGSVAKSVSFSKKEIKNLVLTAEKGHVTSFKLKIPGKTTQVIVGNTLYPKVKDLISTINEATNIMLFDVKTDYEHKNSASIFINVEV